MSKSPFILRPHNPDILNFIADLSSDEIFTPPWLVNSMLDSLSKEWAGNNHEGELWSNPEITFLDPCAKSGVFLREITKRLTEGLSAVIPDLNDRVNHILSKQVFGIATTELTSLMVRRTLYCSKLADGEHSISNSFSHPDGNVWFNGWDHSWDKGKCVYCGITKITTPMKENEQSIESHAYALVHSEDPSVFIRNIFGEKMNFDVVIGNPPYQLSDGGAGTSAGPIYHKFVKAAKSLNPNYISFITPSRWFVGGKGLDEFRKEMLDDERLVSITDYPNSKDVFSGPSIAGGVSYFLWNRSATGPCEIRTIENAEETQTESRFLNEFPIFIRHNMTAQIVRKVISKTGTFEEFLSMESVVSPRQPFGLSKSFTGEPVGMGLSKPIKVRGRDGITFMQRNDVAKNSEWIDDWKVMTSITTSEHGGQAAKDGTRKVLSRLEILPPKYVCTETYRITGTFISEEEAKNHRQYLSTRFIRFLMYAATITQQITRASFMFVPKLPHDRKWKEKDLYKHFNLLDEEIEFIESMIRPMELEDNS